MSAKAETVGTGGASLGHVLSDVLGHAPDLESIVQASSLAHAAESKRQDKLHELLCGLEDDAESTCTSAGYYPGQRLVIGMEYLWHLGPFGLLLYIAWALASPPLAFFALALALAHSLVSFNMALRVTVAVTGLSFIALSICLAVYTKASAQLIPFANSANRLFLPHTTTAAAEPLLGSLGNSLLTQRISACNLFILQCNASQGLRFDMPFQVDRQELLDHPLYSPCPLKRCNSDADTTDPKPTEQDEELLRKQLHDTDRALLRLHDSTRTLTESFSTFVSSTLISMQPFCDIDTDHDHFWTWERMAIFYSVRPSIPTLRLMWDISRPFYYNIHLLLPLTRIKLSSEPLSISVSPSMFHMTQNTDSLSSAAGDLASRVKLLELWQPSLAVFPNSEIYRLATTAENVGRSARALRDILIRVEHADRGEHQSERALALLLEGSNGDLKDICGSLRAKLASAARLATIHQTESTFSHQ
ncbi:hypothetical protein CAC42_3655 [Sphaceloma murrayae]|uniref:Uncharacterized protein n=1 Tax=Sphaceloma murrayae TaxID=2082308 RepID=A0A2K1QPS4_9PEZI|nr:hypothetical protein CAC42_3655 [Sphaceloma murrayae]